MLLALYKQYEGRREAPFKHPSHTPEAVLKFFILMEKKNCINAGWEKITVFVQVYLHLKWLSLNSWTLIFAYIY